MPDVSANTPDSVVTGQAVDVDIQYTCNADSRIVIAYDAAKFTVSPDVIDVTAAPNGRTITVPLTWRGVGDCWTTFELDGARDGNGVTVRAVGT